MVGRSFYFSFLSLSLTKNRGAQKNTLYCTFKNSSSFG